MIRIAKKKDAKLAATLALKMWDGDIDELCSEFESLINSPNAVIFLSYKGDEVVGFAQCQLRFDYVEGTQSSPVGYLEGIYISEQFRRQGYAKELVNFCQDWAKKQGAVEFASDCELDNTLSIMFHKNLGFNVANKIVCFTKKL